MMTIHTKISIPPTCIAFPSLLYGNGRWIDTLYCSHLRTKKVH